jgi:hypothetical protein
VLAGAVDEFGVLRGIDEKSSLGSEHWEDVIVFGVLKGADVSNVSWLLTGGVLNGADDALIVLAFWIGTKGKNE